MSLIKDLQEWSRRIGELSKPQIEYIQESSQHYGTFEKLTDEEGRPYVAVGPDLLRKIPRYEIKPSDSILHPLGWSAIFGIPVYKEEDKKHGI